MDKNYYSEKPEYYLKRAELLHERLSILSDKASDSSADKLKLNEYNIEMLEIAYELDKIKEVDEREKAITKECQDNFGMLYNKFIAIPKNTMGQYAIQIQETYNRLLPMIDKEWKQHDKNILYTQLRDLLRKMRQIQ